MRRYVIAAGLICAIIIVILALFQLSKSRSYQLFGKIVDRVETDRPVVALTLDDGPTLRYTRDVLKMLDDKGIKATFFLTGREMEETPALAADIAQRGHEIGNHSYSHSNMTLMSTRRIGEEIGQTDKAIRAAGYSGDILFRPPYGKKLVTLPWYLSKTGRTTVTWDVEPESDPDLAANADAMTRDVLQKTRNGSIILLHVMYRNRDTSRQALPGIIDGLKARGFRFVTVSELLRNGKPEPG